MFQSRYKRMINKIIHEGEKKRTSKDVLMYHKAVGENGRIRQRDGRE
jgi:hypothetical protein